MICQIDEYLSEVYQQQGNLQSALDYYKSFHQISNQISAEKVEEQTRELRTQFEVEKARRETEIYRLKNVELAQASEYLKYLNTSLKAANEFKSELLSIAAHDMKNPLQAIMAYAELITMESDEESRVFKRASLIYKASQQLFKLINSLLETSAIESGKLKLEKKACELARILEVVVQENEEKAAQKHQLIHLNVEKGLMIHADEHRMQVVLDNLVSNAIKYSPEGAPIWIDMHLNGHNTVRVSVQDKGPGISPEDKKMLFKKFQRLSAKPTKGEKATGLGLWIARQLVEQHDGQIWAESEGDGKGTTFFVELPIHEQVF
ncbi:histidine kinase [Chloroherpeton thalassium ATCC 35110]|uniref:histidine kinase n=1 Tax=Chloroherpeton thalassium (strain ATCC 35110 / GB-78) TaxID=517418 RepID=B3QWX4_CHLT3|nr:HAMP domain-containing sensor histidine kinase [Chloroherpeton thalassium]ACF13338.1 histidine kinase [Chloroherpeton thalassium ATCC 35110]